MKFGFDWPSSFGEKIFENGGQTDNERRMDDGPRLYYKLTNEPKGSRELTINVSLLNCLLSKLNHTLVHTTIIQTRLINGFPSVP